ncbi:response regulator [Pseudomonas sp. RIT-To-2]|uniref:response regulator n=1 Tax=Pseudomonas sp. RIT-To-2 TaxID=3462541 RepID=UPI0024130327
MRRATGPPLEILGAGHQLHREFQALLSQAAPPTLFLDANLNILFFTPATTALMNILPGDIGRPLADLNGLALGEEVMTDAMAVLSDGNARVREVFRCDSPFFERRITTCATPGLSSTGLMVTFTDRSVLNCLTHELTQARQEVESGNTSHLQVLSALSHDLRQPLQTLKLLQALLSEAANDAPARQLAEHIGDTLTSMAAMINAMVEQCTPAAYSPISAMEDQRSRPAPPGKALSDALIDSLEIASDALDPHRGLILLVEDDCDLLKLLGALLHHQGYEVSLAPNGAAALSWIAHSGLKPDLVLTDYHIGGAMNGVQLVDTLRSQWHPAVPAIVLTGDVSHQTAEYIAAAGCSQLNKPTKLKELIQRVHSMFAPVPSEPLAPPSNHPTSSIVYIVNSDEVLRDTVRHILQAEHYQVRDFPSCEAFLIDYLPHEHACLLLDACPSGMNPIDMLRDLRGHGDLLPTIIISGTHDISIAVEAMKAGAWDFIEKPFDRNEILDSISHAVGRSHHTHKMLASRQEAIGYIATLTVRQRQIMDLVLAGHPSKNIAVDLGISQRTVENHRASIMARTHSRSIPALARLALAADQRADEGS